MIRQIRNWILRRRGKVLPPPDRSALVRVPRFYVARWTPAHAGKEK